MGMNVICQARCPESRDTVDWPEFFKPIMDGTITLVRTYFLAYVTDLNAFTIRSYGTPRWSESDKRWYVEVQAFVRSHDGQYRTNLFECCVLPHGKIETVKETHCSHNEIPITGIDRHCNPEK
jgi:hypothetical protein